MGVDPSSLPAPTEIFIPTQHGEVRTVVQRSTSASETIVIHFHGGGFVNRYPEQDLHIARTLAARLKAVVLLPDYATAPGAIYPVAEEQAIDVYRWVQNTTGQAWDGQQVLLSGISAGAKLAINICQEAHRQKMEAPGAAALVVPVTDLTRTDRTSNVRRPAISPFVQRFVSWAYFPEISRRKEKLASPRGDPELSDAMPPTLVLTAEQDTLAAEGAELVAHLRQGGVEVQHHVFLGADHGFTFQHSDGALDQALEMMTMFLGSPHSKPGI